MDRHLGRYKPGAWEAAFEAVLPPLTSNRFGTPDHQEGWGEHIDRTGIALRIAVKRGTQRRRWQELTDEAPAGVIELVKTAKKYADIAIEAAFGQIIVQRVATEEGLGRGFRRQVNAGALCDRDCGYEVGPHRRSGGCTACQRPS